MSDFPARSEAAGYDATALSPLTGWWPIGDRMAEFGCGADRDGAVHAAFAALGDGGVCSLQSRHGSLRSPNNGARLASGLTRLRTGPFWTSARFGCCCLVVLVVKAAGRWRWTVFAGAPPLSIYASA